jgi:predicted choloylglycine hydrolase
MQSVDNAQLLFRAVVEDVPGPKWHAHFERTWPAHLAWFSSEGDGARPGYLTCRKQLEQHMPELVPTWERLTDLAGGGDRAARMLSLYCPPPYLAGCSQAVWTRDEPVLIRNYDYDAGRCGGLLLRSEWNDTAVIAAVDSLWGALDGMNAHGLAVSLAFGGSRVVGQGFGIPLVVRYALECCSTVEEAVEVFRRVPTHMSYTIALVDRSSAFATVFVNPDRKAEVLRRAVSTNHQGRPVWVEHANLTRTIERAEELERRLDDPGEQLPTFIERFLEPPLFSTEYAKAFGTLYTAIYRPHRGTVEYRWRHRSWHQSFDDFEEGESMIRYDSPPVAG